VQILLRADAGDTDEEIAEETDVSTGTVANVRRRFAAGGLEAALNDKPRPGAVPVLDGKAQALVIVEPLAGVRHVTVTDRRAIPGSIEQREFEYVRHGTVNLLTFLLVHTGRMRVTVLPHNDAASYVWALRQFRADYSHLRGVCLIHDGGPSHIAAATDEYLASLGGWWHPRRTPAHASWLNQSELLNHAFEGRYLKRGSWPDRWAFIVHVHASGLEDNRLFAHPFERTWTNPKMRAWFSKHAT
jgi:hypothetical protein